MGVFDDYVTSLEGQENLSPLEVASKLHELHNEELGVHNAKIEELNGVIAERDSALTEAATALTVQKAKNFDLALQIPGAPAPAEKPETDGEIDGATITIDDLFTKG